MPAQPSAFSPSPVPQQWRDQNLYPLDDPQMAMMNVLMDRGLNPYKTNPFMQQILGSAEGLSNLWQLSNIGAKAPDIAANGGPEAMFRDFLMNQLSSGRIMQSLSQGAANFPSYLDQIRGMQDQVGSGGVNPTQIAPFLGGLESALNSPKGFANILGSMQAPALGALGKPYEQGLQRSAFGGWRRYIGDPSIVNDLTNPPNFFDVVMGRR
jgi:hypothetical protein